MGDSPESGSYCIAKTPGKEGKGGEDGEKGKGDETQETTREEVRKPDTNVDDLPSPQEEEKEEDDLRQNTDDRRKEMEEAMGRTRKDAETGSDVELALSPKGSTQSEEEEKYQPTPQQHDNSEAEDSHRGSPREKTEEEERKERT